MICLVEGAGQFGEHDDCAGAAMSMVPCAFRHLGYRAPSHKVLPIVATATRRGRKKAQAAGAAMNVTHEAERGVLSALLQGADPRAAMQLEPADFFDSLHRRLFALFRSMIDRGEPLILLVAQERLRLDNEETARAAALLDPALLVRRDADLAVYSGLVKREARLRDFRNTCQRVVEANGDASALVSDLRLKIERYSDALGPAIPWETKLHRVEELPDGDLEWLIEFFLPAGVTFLGARSGIGKTWVALSMSRALTTGQKFLGNWTVPEPVNVIYLCPEMGARTFKKRCVALGIQGPRFRVQTIADGRPLDLDDPLLLAAVRELRPVIFLDTAIRFSTSKDENSAAENQALARAIFALIHAGAKAVVCLHHRSKEGVKAEELTLENALRGSGDLGAICDVVLGFQYDRGDGSPGYLKETRQLVRLEVACVKARDFRPPANFRIQLFPYLHDTGDFAVLAETEQCSDAERLAIAIAEDPTRQKIALEKLTGIGRNRQDKLAAESGWSFDRKTGWVKS